MVHGPKQVGLLGAHTASSLCEGTYGLVHLRAFRKSFEFALHVLKRPHLVSYLLYFVLALLSRLLNALVLVLHYALQLLNSPVQEPGFEFVEVLQFFH